MSDQWMDRLSEYLDGELAEGERMALEAHLQTCPECTAVVADLRRVVYRARTLERRPQLRISGPGLPPASAPPPPAQPSRWIWRSRRQRRWSFSLPQLAAAGIALMALSGGTVWLLRNPAQARVSIPVVARSRRARPSAINAAVESRRRGPRATRPPLPIWSGCWRQGRGQLDTSTVRVIEQNLAAIDRAIAQAQRALERRSGQPVSQHSPG